MYSPAIMSTHEIEIDASHPSICIPRTFSNINWHQVKTVFEQLFGKGAIERVDVARKTTNDGKRFNCMFVHFNAWPDDERSQEVRQNLLEGKTIKIVYDTPWYWKCSMSRIDRPEKRYLAKRPYIVNDDAGNSVLKTPTLHRASGGAAAED